MIGSVMNSPSFGSTILRNKEFDESIKWAKIRNRLQRITDSGTEEANEFANSLNYLLNDGKDDSYSLLKKEHTKHGVYLLKNGEIVAYCYDVRELGINAYKVITNYVKDDLKQDVSQNLTPAMQKAKEAKNIIAYCVDNNHIYGRYSGFSASCDALRRLMDFFIFQSRDEANAKLNKINRMI